MGFEVLAMGWMGGMEARGNQELDRLPNQFALCMTEQLDRARIRCANHATVVRDKNSVGRDFKQVLQPELIMCGLVALSVFYGVLLRGIRRAHPLLQTRVSREGFLII
jgi:hypothetical protein